MNEKLYEALEVCLNALETGADMESVLRQFPDMKDDLAPLLEAAQQARTLAIPEVPEKVLRRGKARVLGHATGMRKAAVKPRKRWSMFTFPRLATSLAVALVFLLGGTGLVRASNGAIPGDNLYPVKRTWEDVRLTFSFNPEIREELETEFEDERLHEVDELLVEGRHETITFAGFVTEQNGDQWVVSDIPVQITTDSNLPIEPVTIGASIMVEGRTNTQGFVEAKRIEILGAGISLPPFEPTEIEESEMNNNDNSDEHKEEIESLEEVKKISNDESSNGGDSNRSTKEDSSDDDDAPERPEESDDD
jgi:hypothetical protein